jgi:sorbose reductase
MHTDLIIDLLDKQGSEITEQWLENTPMRRMGRPSELQGAVVWMASEASSFMTGANIVSSVLLKYGGVRLTWDVGCGWGI